MAIEVTLGTRRERPHGLDNRWLEPAEREESLQELFIQLSKHHPDLAPVLEDAAHVQDLEIYVNEHLVPPHQADHLRVRDGDSVRLFLK
jgi:hypothetical protein